MAETRGHLLGIEITKRYAGLVANDTIDVELTRGPAANP